jgi:catechol 2,3-dioxygenase-like lactoylglutathione lyase family enzyme
MKMGCSNTVKNHSEAGLFFCPWHLSIFQLDTEILLGDLHVDEIKTSWLGLRHVALNVKNVEVSLKFYQEVLGLRLEWQPDNENVYLTSGGDNLALHQAEEINAISPHQHLDHFGFVVKDPADVDQWAKRIESHGISLSRPPRTHRDGARSFYFADPDGNQIQIIYHPPIVLHEQRSPVPQCGHADT